MGDYGPAHQVGTLSEGVDDLHSGGILLILYTRDRPVTWSTSLYHIRLGSRVYSSCLGEFQAIHGDIIGDEHRFSSLDGRLIGEDHPNIRGNATKMRPGS